MLVSWKGLPRHEATWKLIEDMQQRFRDFYLAIWRSTMIDLLSYTNITNIVGEGIRSNMCISNT